MFTHMIDHMFFSGEGFGAILAPIWCLTRVAPRVIVQMLFTSKRFPTDCANIRLISSMSFHVTF